MLSRWYFIGRKYKIQRKLDGDLVIVSGCTSGIGLAIVKELSVRGAHLILACRDTKRANEICSQLIKKSGNADIRVEELNLLSFASIQKFVERVIKLNKPIYGLVNNAGIFYAPPHTTDDNLDQTFQTNYLGHFLLTILLLPQLRKHPESRIINLASEAHLSAYYFPQPLYHHKFTDTSANRFIAYQYSKFCLVLFAHKLSTLLSNSTVSVHCVDPGNTETNIYRTFPQLSNKFFFYLQKPVRIFSVKTPSEGAQGILYSLLSFEKPPFYIKNCKESQQINQRIYDPILSDALWLISRKYLQDHLTTMNN